MKFYLGVTDNNWYKFLSQHQPEDINFWQPGGNVNFKAIPKGAPFLFKLKSPLNAIGGLGFFSSHTFLPLSVAWDTFQERNGCSSYQKLKELIVNYRKDKSSINPIIGCIVLTNPIFFDESDWLEVPSNWAKSIVQGKSYSTEEFIGRILWDKIETLLDKYWQYDIVEQKENQLILEEPPSPEYSRILTKVRLGQGAFRVLVTDAYSKICAISGEKTLPALEAAHIKPYSFSGPHLISNGLLLRSDIHKLFDLGYLTVNSELRVEVSQRIKEEFFNGREYYRFHGKELMSVPLRNIDKPGKNYLEWHNLNIYKG